MELRRRLSGQRNVIAFTGLNEKFIREEKCPNIHWLTWHPGNCLVGFSVRPPCVETLKGRHVWGLIATRLIYRPRISPASCPLGESLPSSYWKDLIYSKVNHKRINHQPGRTRKIHQSQGLDGVGENLFSLHLRWGLQPRLPEPGSKTSPQAQMIWPEPSGNIGLCNLGVWVFYSVWGNCDNGGINGEWTVPTHFVVMVTDRI